MFDVFSTLDTTDFSLCDNVNTVYIYTNEVNSSLFTHTPRTQVRCRLSREECVGAAPAVPRVQVAHDPNRRTQLLRERYHQYTCDDVTHPVYAVRGILIYENVLLMTVHSSLRRYHQ